MRTSNQVLAFGVGVFVVCGQALPVVSQTVQEPIASSETVQSIKAEKPNSQQAEGGGRSQSEASSTSATIAQPDQTEAAIKPDQASVKRSASEPIPTISVSASTLTAKLQPKLKAAAKLSSPEPLKRTEVPPFKLTAKLQPKLKAAQASVVKASQSAQTPKLNKSISLADFKSQQTQVSQATPATPTPGTTVPGTTPGSETLPFTPGTPFLVPGSSSPGEGIVQSQPISPAKAGSAPDYLNPSPNPLYFPTRPEDVRLRGIQPITLQQSLELAKRNNRDLQISIRQLERSRASLREAEAALYPSLTVQSSLTQSQSASGELSERISNQASQAASQLQQELLNQAEAQGETTTQNQGASGTQGQTRAGGGADRANLALSGTVGLSYDIFTSGQRPARIRAAERQVRADQLQVEITEQQLRLDVSNAYYNLQEADEAVRIQESAVRNAEASLRDTQALERAGLGTRFDVLRAQVQLANARQDLTNATANQQVRRRELARVLAVPPSIDLAAADPVEVAGRWNLTLPQTIVLAFKHRAELEQQLAQRELAEQQRKVALAALGPTVTLQVQYNVLDNLRDTVGFVDGYSLSAGMNWNVFDGGAARARASQQEANIRVAEARFAQARENVQLQVETAFTNLQSSFLNIDTSRQAVAQAREALRLARLRFQAGVGTQTDVINAENDLTRAEGNLITAVLGYNRALASLQRSVTNLPIPVGSTTPSIPSPATGIPPISTPTSPTVQ